MKAKELIEEINVGGYAGAGTCDTVKAGNPEKEIHKVGVTMFATVDTVRTAKEWGADMLIVHEPTYYDHMDVMIDTPVVNAKKALIKGNIDVTEKFMSILNNKTGAWLLTYQDILDHAEELKVSAGKTTFTILYRTKDAVYPSQDMSISFTLNNKVPEIKCSLKPGETTDKGFKLTFNPGIIYEDIGDSFVVINGEVVYEINEMSASAIVNLSTTYEKNGDGAYYVQLVSSSGTIWQSFKVGIKEPLNAWAIVIIVVVVIAVGTVVTVFIVLRRKMRIR